MLLNASHAPRMWTSSIQAHCWTITHFGKLRLWNFLGSMAYSIDCLELAQFKKWENVGFTCKSDKQQFYNSRIVLRAYIHSVDNHVAHVLRQQLCYTIHVCFQSHSNKRKKFTDSQQLIWQPSRCQFQWTV